MWIDHCRKRQYSAIPQQVNNRGVGAIVDRPPTKRSVVRIRVVSLMIIRCARSSRPIKLRWPLVDLEQPIEILVTGEELWGETAALRFSRLAEVLGKKSGQEG